MAKVLLNLLSKDLQELSVGGNLKEVLNKAIIVYDQAWC